MGALRILSAMLGAAAAPPEPDSPLHPDGHPDTREEHELATADLVIAFPAQAENAAVLDAILTQAKERSRLAAAAGSR